MDRNFKIIMLVSTLSSIGLFLQRNRFNVISNEVQKVTTITDASTLKSFQQTPTSKNKAPTEAIRKLTTTLTGSGRGIANQSYLHATRTNPLPDSVKERFKFSSISYDLNQQGWKTVSNVIAVPISPEAKEDSSALIRVNHHDLFLSDDSFLDSRGKQIVFNPNRDRIGILSGIIIVELLDKDTHNKVISDHLLRVDQYAESINTLFITSSAPSELAALMASLLKDKRIKRIEIEILEDIQVRQ